MNDDLTNEQAAEIIYSLLDCGGCDGFNSRQKRALTKAIITLKEERCSDAISRQEAINEFKYHTHFVSSIDLWTAINVIKDLPSKKLKTEEQA